MRVFVCLLASVSIFAGCVGAWWFYWPVWQVESRVKSRLPQPRTANLSGVFYNKATGTACGYVSAQDPGGSPGGKTHFILMPDGELRLDPKDPIEGNTLQQLESLRKHADYLALVYASCQRG
ncbi:hypothetical protein H6CHR_03889 [Variovorax sp. PBL-H6]|uniref:hypothetical protein n=1 Tax=Variovorax sp. PBL-H6 TaxID=434009 RepID=UPI0013183316|nr:hypothetical protein [Variovorax sp. PBL-H6]VTU32876.1 hypothetical protein H6CHR_03889 [Variovorax sp. PBL-H6]